MKKIRSIPIVIFSILIGLGFFQHYEGSKYKNRTLGNLTAQKGERISDYAIGEHLRKREDIEEYIRTFRELNPDKDFGLKGETIYAGEDYIAPDVDKNGFLGKVGSLRTYEPINPKISIMDRIMDYLLTRN